MARNKEKAHALLNKFTSYKKKIKGYSFLRSKIKEKKDLYVLETYKKKNEILKVISNTLLNIYNGYSSFNKKNIESLKHSIKEKSKIERFLKKNSIDNNNMKKINKNYLLIRGSKKMPYNFTKKLFFYSLKIPNITLLSIISVKKMMNFHYYSLIICKIRELANN
mmetsp:Transcript_31341/g.50474  ORF Transcript_31341/g.50474 Transcript_31341/m.50474 type:complete len:165 (+) Transcript_31341:95-589(+)